MTSVARENPSSQIPTQKAAIQTHTSMLRRLATSAGTSGPGSSVWRVSRRPLRSRVS